MYPFTAQGKPIILRADDPHNIIIKIFVVIVIVISEFLERHSEAKRTRAPAYSRALRGIKNVVQKIVHGIQLRSHFQRVYNHCHGRFTYLLTYLLTYSLHGDGLIEMSLLSQVRIRTRRTMRDREVVCFHRRLMKMRSQMPWKRT